jgi:hypothetical protein
MQDIEFYQHIEKVKAEIKAESQEAYKNWQKHPKQKKYKLDFVQKSMPYFDRIGFIYVDRMFNDYTEDFKNNILVDIPGDIYSKLHKINLKRSYGEVMVYLGKIVEHKIINLQTSLNAKSNQGRRNLWIDTPLRDMHGSGLRIADILPSPDTFYKKEFYFVDLYNFIIKRIRLSEEEQTMLYDMVYKGKSLNKDYVGKKVKNMTEEEYDEFKNWQAIWQSIVYKIKSNLAVRKELEKRYEQYNRTIQAIF